MAIIAEDMKSWEFNKGLYNIYIRNFRDNSSRTSAVIENGNGRTWIMEIGIYDDGETSVVNYYDTEEYMIENRVPLIKGNAIRVENVAIDYN